MADIRTLKLQLLADTAQFSSGLNKAQDDTQNFTNKVDTVVANAAKAFLGLATAVGTAAFAIGVSAVKAAIEDEKAQASLAQTLRNTTQATDEQIAATEEYIDATQRATAVGDDQLRPSLQRLLISTNDLAKAQQLQKLALDVAAGSGKSLEEVSNILAKAYDGNFKALKNLGVELKTTTTSTKTLKVSKEDLAKQELNNESASLRVASAQERLNKVLNNSKSDALDVQKAQNSLEKAQLAAAEASDKYNKIVDKQGKTIKVTKEEAVSFDEIVRQLTGLFEGQAAVAAGTFAGRMDLIKIAVNEAQEQIGFALLPLLEKLAKFATDSLIPALEGLVNGLTRSGRQSLTRMASFMADYRCRQIEITRGYGMNEWHDNLKDILMTAGGKNQPTVFMFSDTQIVNETFLEDINNILNSGEVPNLYAADELEKIVGMVRPLAKAAGKPETRDSILQHYTYLVRENLHIVLCMSPIGAGFRSRCRMFPSLVNCCTIDWFSAWPEDALFSVAQRIFDSQAAQLWLVFCTRAS